DTMEACGLNILWLPLYSTASAVDFSLFGYRTNLPWRRGAAGGRRSRRWRVLSLMLVNSIQSSGYVKARGLSPPHPHAAGRLSWLILVEHSIA
ncbi:MAG: hypothetical protein ACP5SH_27225, partial [Syntrophobacteraceae bacterium]